MIESIYDSCFFYNFSSFGIMKMQINNILILVDNDFASIEENANRSAKIWTKDKEYLTFAYFSKFNDAQIKLNSNGIVWTKKSHVKEIPLITDHVANSTSSKKITRKKLLSKK